MKLNGVSIILAVSALTTVVNGKPKGSMMYGINPLEMVFGGLGDDISPMESNQARPIRGIQRILSSQGSNEFQQSSPQQLQMSPNDNIFIMNNDQSNQADNEIDNLMMNNFQQQKNDAAEFPPKSTPGPGVFSSSIEFSRNFQIPKQPESLLMDQNPFLMMNPMMMNLENPTQQRSIGGDEVKPGEKQEERKVNIELDFQVEMPKPNEDKTSKSPMDKDDDILPASVTTAKPNAVPEAPKDGKAILSLLDTLWPNKMDRKPAEQAVSSRCDAITCVPPPKESTCHLQKASITIKAADGADPKIEELSDCCPLWVCTRPDGSFHTHYSMIGKLNKKQAQEPPKPAVRTSAIKQHRISFQSSGSSSSSSNSKTSFGSPRIIENQPMMGSSSFSSSSSSMPFESILRNLFSSPLLPPGPPSPPGQKNTDDIFPQNFMSNSRSMFPSSLSSMSMPGDNDGNLQGESKTEPSIIYIRMVHKTSSNFNRPGNNEQSFQFPQGFPQQQQQQQSSFFNSMPMMEREQQQQPSFFNSMPMMQQEQQQQPSFFNSMPMMQQEQQQAPRQPNFPGLPVIPPMIF